jgi:hypothetical protein
MCSGATRGSAQVTCIIIRLRRLHAELDYYSLIAILGKAPAAISSANDGIRWKLVKFVLSSC